MAEELTRALVLRAERGIPRGAATVLAEADRRAAAGGDRLGWRTGPAIAFAAAVVTLLAVGGFLVANRLLVSDTSPPATIPEPPPVTATTVVPMPGVDPGAADRVFDVAFAPDGRLWAATSAGVVVWDLESGSPTVFSEADGLGGRRVSDVAVAADGTVWVVGDSWLGRYDGAWTLVGDEIVDADLLTPVVDVAAGPDGAVWVATEDALFRIDAVEAVTHPVPDRITSLAVDPAGTVWASTMQAVFAFDGEWRPVGRGTDFPGEIVGNIRVGPDGSVWVGGEGLYGDPAGDVPAGGIARFDGTGWTAFTIADGLLSNSGHVAVGPDGDVWVIHTGVPDHVAATLDVDLPAGLSRYDGTRWLAYPDVPTGIGRGAAVAGDGTVWMPSREGILGFNGATSRQLVVGIEGVPPPGPPGPSVRLVPVEGLEPVHLATSIGQIEFTTWIRPDGEEPPGDMTATAHGVVGGLGPDGRPGWSVDGITWMSIPSSLESSGWSDRSAPFGDDVIVWSVDDGVGRAMWNGFGWSEAETFYDARLDGATSTVVGPDGIVVVRRDLVYYWDGTRFTEAARPPGLGECAGGWMGSKLGPVVATDAGFVALAGCEMLVWTSPDGDEWVPATDATPFGEGAFIRDMAAAGGRIVAVGGVFSSGAAWVSDDGIVWDRSGFDVDQLLQVAGTARGWVAAGHGNTMWFSPDGRTWDGPYARPPGWGEIWGRFVGVAMLDDRIIGVGELSAGSAVVIGEFVDE